MTTEERISNLEESNALTMELIQRVLNLTEEVHRESERTRQLVEEVHRQGERTRDLVEEVRRESERTRDLVEEVRREGEQTRRIWIAFARHHGWPEDLEE